jgi:GNAT superfamily N-acetyltransferase
LEPSRSSSLISRASLRRLLPWPGPAKPDTRHAFPEVTFTRNSLQPFPTPSQWPATDGPIKAPFQIAQANGKHLDTVLDLIDDARSWLWTKKTDQWETPWPSVAARDERVLKGLQNGKTWIVWDGKIAAATVTIATTHNPAVWSEPACTCDLTERAVYVHRLITARDYAGCGLGAELVDWAGLRGRRKNRARQIRIDVWSTNTGLHNYYKSKGFKPCGNCADPEYPSGALFQKPVAGITVPALPKFTETSVEPQVTVPFVNMEETTKLLTLVPD